MDEKIEELIQMANSKKYYQILLIIFGFSLYISNDAMAATFGFWILHPEVNITEKVYNQTTKNYTYINETVKLNYSLCNKNYSIVKISHATWTYSYNIECQQFINSMVNFLGNFGNLVSILLTPISIDLFGEKGAILINGYAYVITSLITIFMPNIYLALLFDFLNNLTGSLMALVFFMSISENLPGRMRSIGLNTIGGGFNVAAFFFIYLFQALNSWKIPLVISSVMNLLVTIFIHIFMYENPRYYLKRGRVDLFIITLKKISRFNRCQDKFYPVADRILQEYEEERQQTNSNNNQIEEQHRSLIAKIIEYNDTQIKGKKYTIIDVLRFRSHRYVFLAQCYLLLAYGGIYQAYQNNIGNLPGNTTTDGLVMSLFDLATTLGIGYVMAIKSLGRKTIMTFALAISMTLNFIVAFAPLKGLYITGVAQAARFFINIFGRANSPYGVELYSSKLMNSALAWNFVVSTVSAMVLPISDQYWTNQKVYLGGGIICLSAIILLFFCPETQGKPQMTEIPEERLLANQEQKIEEGENRNE